MNICGLNALSDFNSDLLVEVPHPDGPPNIALQRPSDGFYATCGTGVKIITFKFMGSPGADERFISAGNVYVAVRDGAQPVAFVKSGAWTA